MINYSNDMSVNELPDDLSRHRLKWSNKEINKLTAEVTIGTKYEEIARIHKRSLASIQSKIISHIVYPIYLEKINEISIIELAESYKLELIDICKYIYKMQLMSKPLHSNNDILNKIEKRLSNIESKIEDLEKRFSYLL